MSSKKNCYEMMMDGPDIHCPKCKTSLTAWSWKDQVLYTCCGCEMLGFNIDAAGIRIDDFKVTEVLEGVECKGCSNIVERREAPGVELYTCIECNIGLFSNVRGLEGLHVDNDDPEGCRNHHEMLSVLGNTYDRLIENLR